MHITDVVTQSDEAELKAGTRLSLRISVEPRQAKPIKASPKGVSTPKGFKALAFSHESTFFLEPT